MADDSALITSARAGDQQAFAALYRTTTAGRCTRPARSLPNQLDVEDCVSAAFASTFMAMRKGGGPTEAFRPYLLTPFATRRCSWSACAATRRSRPPRRSSRAARRPVRDRRRPGGAQRVPGPARALARGAVEDGDRGPGTARAGRGTGDECQLGGRARQAGPRRLPQGLPDRGGRSRSAPLGQWNGSTRIAPGRSNRGSVTWSSCTSRTVRGARTSWRPCRSRRRASASSCLPLARVGRHWVLSSARRRRAPTLIGRIRRLRPVRASRAAAAAVTAAAVGLLAVVVIARSDDPPERDAPSVTVAVAPSAPRPNWSGAPVRRGVGRGAGGISRDRAGSGHGGDGARHRSGDVAGCDRSGGRRSGRDRSADHPPASDDDHTPPAADRSGRPWSTTTEPATAAPTDPPPSDPPADHRLRPPRHRRWRRQSPRPSLPVTPAPTEAPTTTRRPPREHRSTAAPSACSATRRTTSSPFGQRRPMGCPRERPSPFVAHEHEAWSVTFTGTANCSGMPAVLAGAAGQTLAATCTTPALAERHVGHVA